MLMQENRSCGHPDINYDALTELRQIIAISEDWDDLLARSGCNRAFSCSKWYLATVELFPKLQPLVFTAQRQRVLSGILPLWLDANRRLAICGHHYSDHSDIIAADQDLEVIAGLLKRALQNTRSYDRVLLGPVKHESNFVKGAKALGLDEVVDGFFVPGKSLAYAVVDLTRGYDEYMKTLGERSRFNLQCDLKRAKRDGLTVCELTPAELTPELLPDIFLSLHLSRFDDRSDFKSSKPWTQKLFPSLFVERRLRVFAVLNKGRIVGIDTAMVSRSGMYCYIGGFSPEMRRYAPGKLLFHKAIQQACLEGMAEYDLGPWTQDYKGHWRPTRRELGDLEFSTCPQLHEDTQGPGNNTELLGY